MAINSQVPDGLEARERVDGDVGDAVARQVEALELFQNLHSRHGEGVERVVLQVKLAQVVFQAEEGVFRHAGQPVALQV